MNESEKRVLVADFIKGQKFLVVASTWQGHAQAAVVAYSEVNDVEIIISTSNSTRKYRNFKADPKVALVIGWDENVTVQYEGLAADTEGALMDQCRKIHLIKNPGSEVYAYREDNRYIRISPLWIRYTDISQDPEFVFEIEF